MADNNPQDTRALVELIKATLRDPFGQALEEPGGTRTARVTVVRTFFRDSNTDSVQLTVTWKSDWNIDTELLGACWLYAYLADHPGTWLGTGGEVMISRAPNEVFARVNGLPHGRLLKLEFDDSALDYIH